MVRILVIFQWFCFLSPALAGELTSDQIRSEETEKPVSVLQKRFFKKTMRPELGFMLGSALNEAYTNTEIRGLRGALFFNEWVGAEVQYADTSITSSDDRRALNELKYKRLDPKPGQEKDIVTPDPEINRINQILDVNAVVVPFYGKLNILDYAIIYHDFCFEAGLSKVGTDQGQKTAFVAGIGQRFYFFRALALRLDFRDHVFTETRGGANTTRNAYSWDFGVSYFFL